jgi:hypothetical protein
MPHSSDNSYPSDICVMLRAHGEQFWLTTQVLPVLERIEERDPFDEEDDGAALAFLEVLWVDARGRAAETDAAFKDMLGSPLSGAPGDAFAAPTPGAAGIYGTTGWPFQADAQRYHAAVCGLRSELRRRIEPLLAAPGDHAQERAAL